MGRPHPTSTTFGLWLSIRHLLHTTPSQRHPPVVPSFPSSVHSRGQPCRTLKPWLHLFIRAVPSATVDVFLVNHRASEALLLCPSQLVESRAQDKTATNLARPPRCCYGDRRCLHVLLMLHSLECFYAMAAARQPAIVSPQTPTTLHGFSLRRHLSTFPNPAHHHTPAHRPHTYQPSATFTNHLPPPPNHLPHSPTICHFHQPSKYAGCLAAKCQLVHLPFLGLNMLRCNQQAQCYL